MGETIKIRRYRQNIYNEETYIENLEEYVAYWRSNPHRFITEYIGAELYGFQNELIYIMDKYNYFIYAASRGLAKTTVAAWFAVERAILYPNQKIVVTAYEKRQSLDLLTRIQDFSHKYPNLKKEIDWEETSLNKNNAVITFKNHSTIRAMTLSEGSRSYRCEILIADEFALFKSRDLLTSVFTPMMSNTRKPLYTELSLEDKLKIIEPNKELYLSSIRSEGDWSWQYFLQVLNFMVQGDTKYVALALPYHYGVKYGYITPENVAKQFRENAASVASLELVRAEYEAIPLRSNQGSFFKYEDFSKSRTSSDVLIAKTDEEYIEYKSKPEKYPYYKEKKANEIRVMSVDVALIGGNENDNTSIHIFRCQPTESRYKKVLSYAETMNGRHSKEQALRIKQLFYEMECDYLIIDAAGNSISVVEQLMDYTEDPCRGVVYDPWSIMNPDDVKVNSLPNIQVATPVMYAIKVSATENHIIYNNAKRMLENGEIELPFTDAEAITAFSTLYQYHKLKDIDLKRRLLNTFVQTDMLVFETTNLITSVVGTNIKLEPKGTQRKDRFTSWVYGLYLIKKLEEDYIATLDASGSSIFDYIMSI